MTCPFADEQGAYETLAPILGFDPNDPPNDGSGSRSTIITSQFPTETWHDQLGDPTTADAICDRILSNAHRVKLAGPSRRKQESNLAE